MELSVQQPRINVCLDIHGYTDSDREITSILGLEPTRIWSRREFVRGTSIKRKQNHWILDAPSGSQTQLSHQVAALMELVQPSMNRFLALPPGVEIQVYCTVHDVERMVELTVDAATLKRLGQIGARLSIAYYNMSESDS